MSTSPVVVRLDGVSKRFVVHKEKSLKERLVNFGRGRRHREDFWALIDVSLDIEAGSTVGLIGPNGSGKSTLLKTIGGIIQPTTGRVLRRGRLAALLELGAGFHPDLTGRENVYLNAAILGLSQKQTDQQFAQIVDFSGIGDFIDTQVKFYSSGMYVRLAFAVAVHVDPDVLIVDEVLAVGDEPFQRKCMDRIRQFQQEGKTIILVTHSLAQVGELCDRAIVLDHGTVQFDGDAATAIQVLRDDFERNREPDSESTTSPHVPKLGGARLLGVDDDGVLPSGQDLELEIEISNEYDDDDLVVGAGIETPLGQVIWGTNTEMLGEPISLRGTARVHYRLRGLNLGAGQYVVHASLARRSSGEIARIPHVRTFTVIGDPASVGVIRVDVEVDVTRGADGPLRRLA